MVHKYADELAAELGYRGAYKVYRESLKESTTDLDWEEVCKTYCRKKGYEFLFANDSDFGYYDPKSDRMVHKYADELAAELGYRGAYKVYRESLKESSDKEIDRKGFKSLIKYGVHDDGGNYAVLNDGNFVRKFWADNDDEAKVIFRRGPSRKPELTQDPMATGQWYESFKGPKPSKSGLKKHNKQ